MMEVAVDQGGVSSAISRDALPKSSVGWRVRRFTKAGTLRFKQARLNRKGVVPRAELWWRETFVVIDVDETDVACGIRTGGKFPIKAMGVFPIRTGTVVVRLSVLVVGTAADGDSLGQVELIARAGSAV
jgi:hypothetical protein